MSEEDLGQMLEEQMEKQQQEQQLSSKVISKLPQISGGERSSTHFGFLKACRSIH